MSLKYNKIAIYCKSQVCITQVIIDFSNISTYHRCFDTGNCRHMNFTLFVLELRYIKG